ncbi:MAG: hypothetical protein V1745_02400 [Patescibacteria group bacterium]
MFARKLTAIATVITTIAMSLAPMATRAATTGAFQAGDLIKGTQFSTVYYFGPDGRRYVFPNDKTYFTWYTDFSTVKTIPDLQLQTIPLGRSNITYRPGVKMVKIDTDPKTYAVDQGGMLRWVKTEQLAITLFGLNWNQRIDDVPDPFFINYKVGTPIEMATDYLINDIKNATPNIAIDKQFDMTMVTITIGSATAGAFVPASTTVKVGSTVTWTNGDIVPHTVTGNAFDSGTIEKTKTYTRTFNTAGSYDYHDSIYPVMQGTINVVN